MFYGIGSNLQRFEQSMSGEQNVITQIENESMAGRTGHCKFDIAVGLVE